MEKGRLMVLKMYKKDAPKMLLFGKILNFTFSKKLREEAGLGAWTAMKQKNVINSKTRLSKSWK